MNSILSPLMIRRNTQTGFTIIELLIVVVVLAILATITVVAYTGIVNRSHDAATSANMGSISKYVRLEK